MGKGKVPTNDKRRKPAPQNKAGLVALQELTAEVQAALALLDSEAADGIIGEAGAEYKTLIQGARAAMAMGWAASKSQGMRETHESLRYGAQTLSMVLTLVHYAYALGMRRGAGQEDEPCQ